MGFGLGLVVGRRPLCCCGASVPERLAKGELAKAAESGVEAGGAVRGGGGKCGAGARGGRGFDELLRVRVRVRVGV